MGQVKDGTDEVFDVRFLSRQNRLRPRLGGEMDVVLFPPKSRKCPARSGTRLHRGPGHET